ncbi:MAG: OFA family MFS transporter [Thermodesulfobacteriota bacterium]
MAQEVKNKGWLVTSAGICINLALGILYTWSIFKSAIAASIEAKDGLFNWNPAQLNDPYSVCCLCFAFSMVIAGRCQDNIGPRVTAFIGGVLVASGLLLCSISNSYMAWVIGFGVLAGSGFGFGYSAATPPALKWFPPAKTGLIAGLVVSGFGLASVYIAPLSEYLLNHFGINRSMMVFGWSFLIVVCGLSLLLVNPPKGYVPEGAKTGPSTTPQKPKPIVDATPSQMLKSPNFYILWVIYFIGSGVGLMVISSIAGMAKKSLPNAAFLAVAIMAVGNAGGRIVAGILSDKIGRNYTLLMMLMLQALLMIAALSLVGSANASPILILLLATFIGFSYGSNLSLFPSLTKDLWGLKSFGLNYGILFSAWGIGGFVMSRASQMMVTATGGFHSAFVLAATLCVVAAALTFTIKPVRSVPAPADVYFQPKLGFTMADGGEKIQRR